MKAENPYFTNQKFFTPVTSFLPPLFSCERSVKLAKIENDHDFNVEKGGKKLVMGVKNF